MNDAANNTFMIKTLSGEMVNRAKACFVPNETDAEIQTRRGIRKIKVFQTSDGRQYWRDKNGTIRRVKKGQVKAGV